MGHCFIVKLIGKRPALKANQGDFDKHMTLSPKAHQDMLWWVEMHACSKSGWIMGKLAMCFTLMPPTKDGGLTWLM